MRIIVLNGVNLNILGRRDPTLYGGLSIAELESRIYEWARDARADGPVPADEQRGRVHQVVPRRATTTRDGMVVNPGAWTHYAWSIHDALEPLTVPIVEVHLSNVDERDDWRRIVRDRGCRRRPLRRARPGRLPHGTRIPEGACDAMNDRIARLREQLEEPLLVTNPKNVVYLVGFEQLERDAPRRPGARALFTDFRYLAGRARGAGVEVVQTRRAVLGELGESLAGRIAFESSHAHRRSRARRSSRVDSSSSRAAASSSVCGP